MTKPTKPAAVDGPTLDDAADAQLFSSKTFAWVEFTPLAVQFMADSNDYVDLVAAAVDADAMATEAGRAQAVLKAGEAADSADDAEEFKDDAETARDLSQIYAAAAGAAAGVPSLVGNAGKFLSPNSTEDGVEWIKVLPTTETTNGATQEIDFSTTTHHVSIADAEVVTFNFVGAELVDEIIITIKNEAPGYDWENASKLSQTNINTDVNIPCCLRFGDGGLKMYTSDFGDDGIHQWTLSVPYKPSEGKTYNGMLAISGVFGFDINPDGSCLIAVIPSSGAKLAKYDLSVPHDVTTGSIVGSPHSIQADANGYSSIRVRADGLRFWVGRSGEKIRRFSMATAWDPTSETFDGAAFDLDISGEVGTSDDFTFSPDYQTAYVIHLVSGGDLYRYDLVTAEDTGTGSYSGVVVDLAPFGCNNPSSFEFYNDGLNVSLLDRDGTEKIFDFDTSSALSLVLPSELEGPEITPPARNEKIALKVWTTDEGGTYQFFLQEGIS